MTFPNAYHGVKKIFTAELLKLIGAGCLLLLAVSAVIAAVSAAAGEDSGLLTAGILSVIFGIAGVVLPIIGYIMNIVGLYQASKDEENFKTAFAAAIIALVISAVSGIFSAVGIGAGVADNISRGVSTIMEIVILVFVVGGISALAEKLHKTEMVTMGGHILIIVIIINGLRIIADIIPMLFGANNTTTSIEGIMQIVAGICAIVGYIVYLVYLGKAKNMLRDN